MHIQIWCVSLHNEIDREPGIFQTHGHVVSLEHEPDELVLIVEAELGDHPLIRQSLTVDMTGDEEHQQLRVFLCRRRIGHDPASDPIPPWTSAQVEAPPTPP